MMTYSEFAITRLKDKLTELAMKDGTPRKYAVVMFEAMEVIKQREAERDKILGMIHGDCRYCTHNKNPMDGPCKGCVHFAAKEFVEGDYWECRMSKEAAENALATMRKGGAK